MPLPAKYSTGAGRLAIDGSFGVALSGYSEPRLERAAARLVARLSRETGIPMPGFNIAQHRAVTGRAAPPALLIECKAASKPVQELGEDESYTLDVDSKQARLSAPNPLGILRGMETFLQLVEQDREGFGISAIGIQDSPRFAWRGLMLDVSRHWMPLGVVKRTLDAMSAVKFNVFHWHLSDDQGFRVESKKYPKLQEMGSDGHYYTQAQVREVIEYARDRGIRVVPEFDMPGHTTSWLAGYPDLATVPGAYQIERHWGIMDACLDPTKESTYQFVDGFIGEMAGLFDDKFFHIGGDEVNGKQWSASEHVQAFMRAHNLKNTHELQRYFTRRVQPIVTKYGKRTMGWDEILDPDLPKDIVIQSWRGQKALGEAARQGYEGLLSNGYYLDLMQSTEFHYLNDPVNEAAGSLTDAERARILGGEACMWSEFVTPGNVDTRLWPRAAAVAERLWSPQSVRDVASMYRRLDNTGRWLEWFGTEQRENHSMMLNRLAGDDPVGPLRVLADIVEPVKLYTRGATREYTQFSPLNRLVDTVYPESDAGREFRNAVAARDWTVVRSMLAAWRDNDARVRPTLERHALLQEILPVSANLAKVAAIGLEALDRVEKGTPGSAEWAAAQRATLEAARKPAAELLLMAVPGVESLVTLAAGGSR
jgi:hexosaminidase